MSLANLTDTTWNLGLKELHQIIKDVEGMESFLAADAHVFTLIAPSDDAFAVFEMANPGLIDSWRSTGEAADRKLREFLYYHMIEGQKDLEYILSRHSLTSYSSGREIPVRLERKTLLLGNGKVTQVDLKAKNGIIHVVDSVLVPIDGWGLE